MERLNGHIKLHQTFQAHQVATATGCSLDAAMLVLNCAVASGALGETTIFYNGQTNNIVHIGELEKLEIYDEDTGTTLEESDLTWDSFFFVNAVARAQGWQFVQSK